jgi:hypothetical protein
MSKTVYVTAWEYESGGGFDWYHTADAADKAYEEEKKVADKNKESDWTAFRFDYDTESEVPEEITNEISLAQDKLCEAATIKYGPRA